jgi:transcriptional regulator with PAS, ATPase and Fis domain
VFSSTQGEMEMFGREMTLKEYTESIIRHFLKKYNNNVLKVAAKLDIGKSTIYNLLKRDKEAELN